MQGSGPITNLYVYFCLLKVQNTTMHFFVFFTK